MTRQRLWASATLAAILLCATGAGAETVDLHVTMQRATPDGPGPSNGSVTIRQGQAGAEFVLALQNLPPGPHGFHVHENGRCGPTLLNGVRIPAGAAGGHFDPAATGQHGGPAGSGHMGDLPLLEVAEDGTATQTLTAPRIKDITALKGRALVIHVGGDNYSDQPAPLGGGGLRLSCGVIGE